jgi:hypothetical protein
MAKKKDTAASAETSADLDTPATDVSSEATAEETWTPEELLAVRHMGPGIIGEAKYKAAQAYVAQTGGGMFGPALISDDPKYNQAGPTRPVA